MSRLPLVPPTLLLPALLAVGGCATYQHQVFTPVPVVNPRGVVFSVDGAGGFQATSVALSQAITAEGLPLQVEPVTWSHGFGRVLADQVDFGHAREEGCRLAARVAAWRRQRPQDEVYLVGHSAGSAVVLAAAEALPPDSVDRIVLLAPSVSADYDLRPVLRCARRGVDVFYSGRDFGYLGVGTALVGTADRSWLSPAAGRVGFRPRVECPADAALYARLCQHGWDPCLLWTGNLGGHYGGYQPGYLRAYVLPLFSPSTG